MKKVGSPTLTNALECQPFKALESAFLRPQASFGLVSMLRGIVFLGSPHMNLVNKQSWPSLITLLKYTSKLPKVALTRAELEIQKMASLCMQFDKLDLNLPIISAYETTESVLSKNYGRVQKSVVSTPLEVLEFALNKFSW